MKELRGKVAVVTGAASGIGEALATRLAAEGMKLVLADVDEAGLERVAAALVRGGAEAAVIRCDVSSAQQVEDLAREALSAFGAVHLVCNNAGIAGTTGRMWELDAADWQRILGVNLLGAANGIRAFVPLLLRQGEGHVVNTASQAGLLPAALGDYSVTKHAVVALSEALYYDLALTGSGVGVSVLCPGWVRTNIASSRRVAGAAGPDPMREAVSDLLRARIAGGSDPAEVADRVVAGIREGRFYIVTGDDGWANALRTRVEDIVASRPPSPPSL